MKPRYKLHTNGERAYVPEHLHFVGQEHKAAACRADVATALKEERLKLGLSQAYFGQFGGVTKQIQAAYENGLLAPPADYLALLFKGLGCDVAYIITGKRSSA